VGAEITPTRTVYQRRTKMSKNWKLTYESPKESGDYITVSRGKGVNGYYYSIPRTMMYSKRFDAWNAYDGDDGAVNRIPDLRNAPDGLYDSYIFAWMEIEPLTAEEIAELEKGVA
jgi:hypothetical protein